MAGHVSSPLAAGDFITWLGMIRSTLGSGTASDVPCGECTACCTGAQFVQIAPDETDALAHIPAELLFPAPGLPDGHVLLGYDEHGHCPMLVSGACSVYDHRPQACRAYDCRVFAATGVESDKPEIAMQVRRWRFTYADDAAIDSRAQIRATAERVGDHASPTQRAVLALRG